ncbi:MAG: hypothetical protein ABIK64_07150, partial [Bacillota bacterium]
MIVKGHKIILILFIVLAVAGIALMFQVNINADMTKYLPESSPAKQGVSILNGEFPPASAFTLMFESLAQERRQAVYEELQAVDGVLAVNYDATGRYNSGDYTLYEITVSGAPATDAARAVVDRVKDLFEGD